VRRIGSSHSNEALSNLVTAMTDCLVHRGPDGSGTWNSPDGSVVFGHRRLAIIDLSPAGHQPMSSRDGQWTITYNGELYNTADLRDRLGLEPVALRGHSDTEVLVECLARWGVEKTLREVNGMFAFGAFHQPTGDLWLARDRFGEKPLYISERDGLFAFASELSALEKLPGPRPSIDRSATALLLRHGYIPAPYFLYEGVQKLQAGHVMRVASDGTRITTRYWDPIEASQVPVRSEDDASIIDELEALLTRTVASRMVSDVPLGAFLSGGIDSSLVTALMCRVSNQPPKTFSIGFDDPTYNEAPYAKAIAQHLGTDHTEVILSQSDALAIVPKLPSIYSEPFADSSQIPTRLVSEVTRRSVTVALSGDGGDELFSGYDRYRYWPKISAARKMAPSPVRRVVAKGSIRVAGRLLSGKKADRAQKFLRSFGSPSGAGYRSLMSDNDDAPSFVINASDLPSFHQSDNTQLLDTLTYLPDDILTKVDRASMSVSLEVRVPLLDQEVFAFAWSLPPHLRVDGNTGKVALRRVLERHVPSHMFERPKMGFGVPVSSWLRGPLRAWADELLDPALLREQGILRVEKVTSLWFDHVKKSVDNGPQLWPILMLQAWLQENP
jgi:asparagine synthase (glutamine-hydrolysing)